MHDLLPGWVSSFIKVLHNVDHAACDAQSPIGSLEMCLTEHALKTPARWVDMYCTRLVLTEKCPFSKKTEGCESSQRSGAWGWGLGGGGERGMASYWQWWRRECITGSCVLYELDREGFTKKEVTWKRDSQSEREASQPLESSLRLTPSYSPPYSICKYSTSSEDSPRHIWCYFTLLLLGQEVLERKLPLVYSGHTQTDRC